MSKKITVIAVLFVLTAVLGATVRSPDKAIATSCPLSGDVLVGSVVSPNGNTTIVCRSTSGGHSWYVFNSSKTQIGSGGCSCYTNLLELTTTNDSKVVLVLRGNTGGSSWHVLNSSGTQTDSGGCSCYTSLLSLVMTGDSKVAIVYGSSNNGLSWEIIGSSGTKVDGGGWGPNASIVSATAFAQNKFEIVFCANDPNEKHKTIYGVNGLFESDTILGPCSGGGVGGIAELPQITGIPAESDGLSEPNTVSYIAGGIIATLLLVVAGLGWMLRRRWA